VISCVEWKDTPSVVVPGGENCLTQIAVLSAIGGNRGGVLGLTSNYCDIVY
jgi:hypothetical protein